MAYSAVKDVYPDIITWVVFFATIIWVTMFDTIYAISDKDDDVKIGINSTAILFGEKDKMRIAILQSTFYSIFAIFGYLNGYSYIFFTFLIFLVSYWLLSFTFVYMKNVIYFCIMAFKNNQYIGLLIFLGIYGEYIL